MDELVSKFSNLDITNQDELDDLANVLNQMRIEDNSNPLINYMLEALISLTKKTPCRPFLTEIKPLPIIK